MAYRAAEYERFEGERARVPPWWPLWRATFRRGWSSKWIRILSLASLAPALGFTILIYVLQEVVPGWRETLEATGQEVGRHGGPEIPLGHPEFYLVMLQVQLYPFLLPMAMLMGYELLSGDLRTNALEAYFARPITPWGYVFGRTLAFTAYLLLATLVPLLWIWVMDVLTGPEGTYGRLSGVPWGLAAAMTLMAVTMALFIQALTTITRSGMWTALVVAILFILSGTVGSSLFALTGDPRATATTFFGNIFSVANGFLDFPVTDSEMPPFGLSLGILLAVMFLSLAYLLRKVKRRGAVG